MASIFGFHFDLNGFKNDIIIAIDSSKSMKPLDFSTDYFDFEQLFSRKRKKMYNFLYGSVCSIQHLILKYTEPYLE